MTPPSPPPGMSRRRLLAGAGGLGALAAVSAAGCAAPARSAPGKTRMRYWHLFGGGDGVNMAAMVDAFRAAHPDLYVEAYTLSWGAPYYTKIGMAGAGGRSPEVAVTHLTRMPGLAPGLLLDAFDLDLLAENGVTEADFPEDLWRRSRVNGELYAVPLDTHPIVLYYQTEICEQAGLLADDGRLAPIEGADAFADALRAARDVTGKPALVIETLGADTIGPWRIFATFYSQTGATILNDDGTRITLDDDKALEVMRYMRMLTHEGLATRRVDYAGTVGLFGAGESAFFLNGEWEVSTFKNLQMPFSMTRVPNLFGRPTAQADAHAFILPHQRDRGGASNEAAHTFVAWMLKHSVDWAEGGHVPAYTPVLDEPEYLELEPQSQYRSVIDDVALDPPAWFAGSASSMWIELGAVLSGVLTGSRTPENALTEMRSRLQALLDTPPPFGETA